MEIANCIVLLEPEWEKIKEVQAIGRVNRIRSPHRKTFCYRMHAENSPIESGIIERRQGNKILSDLVLGGYEGYIFFDPSEDLLGEAVEADYNSDEGVDLVEIE